MQPFGTFGGPDIVATLGAVARVAINAVWYQKWIVHLRHRPESGGGIVHLMKTGLGSTVQAQVDKIVLDSAALQQSLVKNGTYLLYLGINSNADWVVAYVDPAFL